MVKPVGCKEVGQDTRWHSLGLLDDNIKSLKKQIEVLAQELRSAVAERDKLLSNLSVLQWPGLERDAKFLQRLPGSVRKGGSVDWRCDARSGRYECQNGSERKEGEGLDDGEGEESSQRQIHRRGQSWNGWDNRIHRDERQVREGRMLGRNRNRSLDSILEKDETSFARDLPTHRGPSPSLDVFSLESSVDGEQNRVRSSVSSGSVLSSISENDGKPISDRQVDGKPEELTSPPSSPFTTTDADPHWDLESPSEDPVDEPKQGEEGDPEDPSCPRRWLSNSAYRGNLTDSPVPPAEMEDPPEAGLTPHQPHVRMRTTHVALVERANRASRLSKELFQARFALHDSQSQLQFLTERMMMYKKSFQEEVKRHEEEALKLRGMLNDATTAKFIMFCKLSECQEKVQQLEEQLVMSRVLSSRSNGISEENIDQNRRTGLRGQAQEKVDSTGSPTGGQGWVRGSSMSTIERGPGRTVQSVVGNDLQRRLTDTMRLLLAAQSRGDQLQQRLQELEAQLKKGGEDAKSVLSSDLSMGPGSQKRGGQNRTWMELKQTRVELKRARIQLHKCEAELSTCNRIRFQQEAEIGKLRLELKEAKRRKPPKWR